LLLVNAEGSPAEAIKNVKHEGIHMKINSPAELRSILLQCMEKVIEGKMSVNQANAVAALSAEAHKSIRQQWEMTLELVDNPKLQSGGYVAGGPKIVAIQAKAK